MSNKEELVMKAVQGVKTEWLENGCVPAMMIYLDPENETKMSVGASIKREQWLSLLAQTILFVQTREVPEEEEVAAFENYIKAGLFTLSS